MYGNFYPDSSVEAAISLSFDYFSIMTQVLDIYIWAFFDFLKRKFVVWICYLETSAGIFYSKLVWIFVY